MIKEIYRDGQLIETVEVADSVEAEIEALAEAETVLTISKTAVDVLMVELADPAVNSISKMKVALTEFFNEVKGV